MSIEVDYIHHCGDDLTTVNAARVSFDKESDWEREYGEPETGVDGKKWRTVLGRHLSAADTKLINYLAKHGHYSPLGHSFISVRVTAPVFVSRQLVKHKFLRINEVSRRYVDDPPEFFVPDAWRSRAENKKQGSGEGEVTTVKWNASTLSCGDYPYTTECTDDPHRMYISTMDHMKWFYEMLIDNGVAPEQARMVLPQSMMTSWYWSGSLDAFAAMANLRIKPDAQAETRQVAQMVEDIIYPLFPVSWAALRGYN